jgi:hypothetical protein
MLVVRLAANESFVDFHDAHELGKVFIGEPTRYGLIALRVRWCDLTYSASL